MSRLVVPDSLSAALTRNIEKPVITGQVGRQYRQVTTVIRQTDISAVQQELNARE